MPQQPVVVTPRVEALVIESLERALQVVGDSTPAVAYLGREGTTPLIYVMHDYWPSKDDRALALGQAATVEMMVGGAAVEEDVRYGILWAHVAVVKAGADFSDETGLSWRRLEDATGLDSRETEALLGLAFDIDAGFEVEVLPFERGPKLKLGQLRRYAAVTVREPLPGLILMRTIAENAPVKEYT
jgi:hypothetical protein